MAGTKKGTLSKSVTENKGHRDSDNRDREGKGGVKKQQSFSCFPLPR